MKELDVIDEQKAGNRLGCLLVFLPALAFFIVTPDAVHVWRPPLANPLLWLLAVVTSWFLLRWLINQPVAAVGGRARILLLGTLLAASLVLAWLILRSV